MMIVRTLIQIFRSEKRGPYRVVFRISGNIVEGPRLSLPQIGLHLLKFLVVMKWLKLSVLMVDEVRSEMWH